MAEHQIEKLVYPSQSKNLTTINQIYKLNLPQNISLIKFLNDILIEDVIPSTILNANGK